MKGDLSGREQLVRLIRGDTKAFKSIKQDRKLKTLPLALKTLFFSFIKAAGLTIRWLFKGELKPKKFDIKIFNRCLAIAILIMLIYLVFDFVSEGLLQKEITLSAQRTTPNHSKPASGQAQITKLSPLGYYLDRIGGKDLFSPQRIALVKAKAEISSGQPTTGLKLVGVDWGGNPVALIEDTQTQKTYFVKKGEFVKDLKVMEIFRDRVKLRYDNKVIELK